MPPKRASRAKASSTSKDTDSQDVVMEGHTPAVAIESAAEESNQAAVADGDITAILKRSVKRTRELFAEDQENIYSTPTEDQLSQRVKLQSKIHDEYKDIQVLPHPLLMRQKEQLEKKKAKTGSVIAPAPSTTAGDVDSGVERIFDTLPKKSSQQSSALVMHKPTIHNPFPDAPGGGTSLVRRPVAKAIRPEWHAPWKLMRVISGHQG
ncbi:pre-mRNA-splicing factor prp46, partial [Mortierella sp. GBA39]